MTGKIRIAQSHHEVLEFWQAESALAGTPLDVICFDHHTDTLPAFGRMPESARPPVSAPVSARECAEAIALLRHDEHFDYALRAGILRSAVIFSSMPTLNELPGATVLSDPEMSKYEQIPPGSDPVWRGLCARALESGFLRELSRGVVLPEQNFILDLDLDYFKCRESFFPRDGGFFRRLLSSCRIVTVSRENDWVKILGCDRDWDADQAQRLLLERISLGF